MERKESVTMGTGDRISESETGVTEGQRQKPSSMHRGDIADQGGEIGNAGDIKMGTRVHIGGNAQRD